MILKEPIVYHDRPDQRLLDLRPLGLDCFPLLCYSIFHERRRGTVYHIHPGCTEFCLCLKGRLVFESEGKEFNFLPGTVFVSAPDQPHRMRNNPKGLKLMSILFAHPSSGSGFLGLSHLESKQLLLRIRRLPQRLFSSTERVRNAFKRLFSLYDDKDANKVMRKIEMRCAALELLLAIVEASQHVVPRFPAKFKTLVDRMQRQPGENYPICELAKEVGLTVPQVTEIFKRSTGLPPHAWLIECRIRAAQELLAATNDSITAISDTLGFSSPQHFAGSFLKSVGLTPNAWRKRSHRPRRNSQGHTWVTPQGYRGTPRV